jgi:hypothetical protein
MSQSSITAAALIVAFLIFITVRGELSKYLGAFGFGASQPSSAAAAGFGIASNITALAGVTPQAQTAKGISIGIPGIGSIGISI